MSSKLLVLVPVAVWRAFTRAALPIRLRTLYLTGGFVGAVLVLAQTALGSVLVYRHGVGLAASARLQPAARASQNAGQQ